MVLLDTGHLSLSGNELYGVLNVYVSFRSEERDALGCCRFRSEQESWVLASGLDHISFRKEFH